VQIGGPSWFSIQNLLTFDGKWFGKLERDRRLRREFDILPSGGARGCKSAARANTRTNGRSLAAASKSADQRADRSAATGDHRGALTLTFLSAAVWTGRDRVALAVNFNAGQTDGQNSFAFEGTLFLGVNDGSRSVRALRNGSAASDHNGFGDGGFNSSPGLATLELMVLVKTTVIGVSAGTTIGRGGSGAGFCALADWLAPCWLLSVDGFVEVSPLLQPAASPSVAASPSIAHLLFMVPPFFLECEFSKTTPRR